MRKRWTHIRIYRETLPLENERSVHVFKLDNERHLIDPERMVSQAVGTWVSREGCIVGMADGFVSAGHRVLMHYRGQTPRDYRPKARLPKLCYFLFGLAWIRGEWPSLTRSLAFVVPLDRLFVLEYTALHYVVGRCDQPIRLQIP